MADLSRGEACGGYENNFKYIDGPLFDGSEPYGADLSLFNFDTISAQKTVFEGYLLDKSWLGTHKFQI